MSDMSDMWNSVADAWERHADFVDVHMAEATTMLLDAARVGPGAEVLEVAAGPGGVGLAAADRVGADGRVVIADVAPAMVEVAGRRSDALPQVSTAVFDQVAIDAPDASFDAVVSRHGLMFAVPPETAVAEAVRVLRPGGRYGAITWDARAANPWLGLVLDAVGVQFGVPFPPPGVAGPFELDDPALLAGALEAGDLEDVRVERLATPMRTASLDEWWSLVPEMTGPLAIALAGMEPDVRDAIRDRALASGAAAAREHPDGIEMDGSVLVGSGRRSASP